MSIHDGPVALVTGARKGLGQFLAQFLLKQGYRVVGCSRKPCEWSAEGFTDRPTDVTNEEQVRALIREIGQTAGRLDAVLNNAGAASLNHSLLTPVETFARLTSTNVIGTWLVSREAAKVMQKRKFGRIVNFSSIAVPMRLSGHAAYVASKAGVESLSQVMARELAESGITVNVVGATPIATDMTRGVPADTMARLIEQFPIKRMGTFEDVANVVDFFLRSESAAVTGQVIYLGGVPNT
jgi:3-oxoacyl-[acyl-carrier protein] reductase